LAQRLLKRARTSTSGEPPIVIEDEPPARTVGTSETIVLSPEISPRRSPQRSPQRESSTHFPLASVGEHIFATDIVGHAGEEQQHEVSPEVIPDVPPPSTTPPRDGSPARASTGEPTGTGEVPAGAGTASTGTGGSTPTTSVAGERETIPPELNTGKPLALENSFYLLPFFLPSSLFLSS
jgi:hypothetical protein